ncbi:unnamed protein product [Prunus armeniaca]
MAESHKGICGAHRSNVKMRWLVRRHEYYWPTILENCIEYVKGCIKCQIYGLIQRVPADALHPVTKPWPFRDGPWISSVKSTRPHPTSTPGFWWQLTISLNGSRRSPISPFLAHRWSDSSKITLSTDSVYPKPSRPITARCSHQPRLENTSKGWGSNWSTRHPTTHSLTDRPRRATR